MSKRHVSLNDKYALEHGRVFVTGIQALVRLPLDQRRMDRASRLNTAGFISGYRGSPLGGYDQQLHRAADFLAAHDVVFQEGINEDLAATAVWGSQQVGLFPGARADGVFGLWYGKAPGIDRSGDVLKHANFAGTAPRGGVLAVAGDDPQCKSSTLPSQSEFAFADAEIPVLNPAGVQEVLDYGLYGWALSRYSGLWCGLIALSDTMDSSAVIDVGAERLSIAMPTGFVMPAEGLGLRRADEPMAKEARLRRYKLPAAQAFVRANRLDRVVLESSRPRLGIVATGQGVRDVFEALENLGLPLARAAACGITVFKVAMPWPLEPSAVRAFAAGLEEILVVEHKRALIEPQAKAALYDLPQRPRIVGKHDETGAPLLSELGALSALQIAQAIYARLPEDARTQQAQAYFARVGRSAEAARLLQADVHRLAHFCSGCPHNTSTVVPEGSRALAGIGCHYMATFMDRADMASHMGGEGAAWIGQAPFTDEPHVFVNMGDGTYSHSGSLAIRAAVAAGINATYKLLYNGAVAMTGGQEVETGQSVPDIVFQMKGEKVARIAIVADDVSRYGHVDLGGGVAVYDRAQLDEVQRQMREVKGVSVIIYDQVCAAEQRRKIKRKIVAPKRTRVFINTEVCEGCGDCSVQSNCLSIEPLETELGTKRAINQNSCNLDTSCVKGFCPSFVTVEGAVDAHRTHAKPAIPTAENLPEPPPAPLMRPWNILFAGVGGTGVTTIAAIIGMAAHIDGNAATALDMAGLAQKGGPVLSHIRIAREPQDIRSARTPAAAADAAIVGDLIVAAGQDALSLYDEQRTRVIANWDVAPTSEFIRDRSKRFDSGYLQRRVEKAVAGVEGMNAEALAAEYFYDNVYANAILLGYAWARGLMPVSLEAMREAIRLNGAGVIENLAAFDLGRAYAQHPARFAPVVPARAKPAERALDDLIAHRAGLLAAYQDEKYAGYYRDLLAHMRAKEQIAGLGEKFSRAVATYAYKLMAYKDEYEVARLYADGRWAKSIRAAFTGDLKAHFHLAPPFLSGAKDAQGRPRKRKFDFWMFYVFKVLARLKGLRGTRFDPFAANPERKIERALRDEYVTNMRTLADGLSPATHDLAVRLAELPDMIRGFGPVKAAGVAKARAEEARLRAALEQARTAVAPQRAAE
jgi:indolepyruvate ferredoxin oxidoreductase